MKVILCGLGPAGIETLTLGALKAMQSHRTFLRTGNHGAAQALREQGIGFETMDDLYESCADFDELCQKLCARICAAARQEDVVYAVPSGAGLGDATIPALCSFLKQSGIETERLPGVGYGEAAALGAGGLDGAVLSSAQSLSRDWINTRVPLVLYELDNRLLAGQVKLLLTDFYPAEHPIRLILGENQVEIPLGELDRQKNYSHLLCAVVPPVDILALSRYDFTRLQDIAAILRGKSDRFEGCPWDMEQTHASMRGSMIEEAYEAADAIDRNDPDQLCDELGDVLLQVALHAQVASEYDEFDAQDVITAVCRKMIRRHPHVFGQVHVANSAQVLENWDQIKRTEQPRQSAREMLEAIPRALPALLRASKALKRTGDTALDCQPLLDAAQGGPRSEEQIGQALLCLVRLARACGVEAETALERATDRYIAAYAGPDDPAK